MFLRTTNKNLRTLSTLTIGRTKVQSGASGKIRTTRESYGPDWFSKVKETQDRDGNKCLDCGNKEHLHTHHIKRLGDNGTNSKANRITLCERCHEKRHSGRRLDVSQRTVRQNSR